MSETPISVTVAARNFSDCINLVRYKGASFLLEKNGVPVARIVPVPADSSPDPEQLRGTFLRDSTGEEPDADQRQEPLPKRPALNW
jgi:antitoxin (DNA-binding transcriptional repressor) of toxin-antitoxin stability system